MNDIVRKDILDILRQSKDFIRSGDMISLRELSNHTVHNASIFQDKESITIAVVIYALSKLENSMSRIMPMLGKLIDNAISDLSKHDDLAYDKDIGEIIDTIKNIDQKINLYIQHIINRAEIKKGSKIYEHGISLGQAADILGISQWELMRYIGQTKITDRFDEEVSVMNRIRFARKLFS